MRTAFPTASPSLHGPTMMALSWALSIRLYRCTGSSSIQSRYALVTCPPRPRLYSLPPLGSNGRASQVCSSGGVALVANFVKAAHLHMDPERLHCTRAPNRVERVPTTTSQDSGPHRRLVVCDLSDRLPLSLDIDRLFATLYEAAPLAFWLDAREPPRGAAAGERRFSYMGAGGGPHSYLLRRQADGAVERLGGDADEGVTCVGAPARDGTDGGKAEAILTAMREGLAMWAGAVPTLWNSEGSNQDLAEAPMNERVGDGEGRPVAAVLPEELDFRCGFTGWLDYEAWHWLGPTANATELQAVKARAAEQRESSRNINGDGDRPFANSAGGAGGGANFLFADRLLAVDHSGGDRQRLLLLCLCDEATEGSVASANRWLRRTSRAIERLASSSVPRSSEPIRTQKRTMPTPLRADLPTLANATLSTAHAIDPRVLFSLDRSEEDHLENIHAIQRELHAGSSYEVCVTNQLSTECPPPSAFALYSTLCSLNPAPHAAYLRMDPHRLHHSATARVGGDVFGRGGVAVCSSSPERFLRVRRNGRVECKPIKGTAARADSAAADAAVAAALGRGVKERAENLMITDLIRNDLSRVCAVGSVEVPSLLAVETFATVHQLVSTISADLDGGADALDATAAAFPPGSMTGAPKVPAPAQLP